MKAREDRCNTATIRSVTDLEVERVVPFPEAVVESHVQPGRSHTFGEVTDEVTLRPQVNTVPVPVVDALKVTPALVVLGGQDHVCGDNGRGIGGRGTMGEEGGQWERNRGQGNFTGKASNIRAASHITVTLIAGAIPMSFILLSMLIISEVTFSPASLAQNMALYTA